MGGKAIAIPPFEREAQRFPHGRTEIEPSHQHVADFAPRGEVVHRPLVGPLLDHLHDLLALLRGMGGGRKRQHVAHHLGRVRGIVDQRPGANGDFVAEEGGHLVGVAGAADIAQERDPVDRVAQRRVEARRLAHPHRKEAGAHLRLERLAERVVLREGERGDELTQAEGGRGKNGEVSRCSSPGTAGKSILHDHFFAT